MEQMLGGPILPAGYEGYTGGSWQQLTATSPETAGYITLLFRMYGSYIVAFSLLALAIAANRFQRGERWTWWALLVGNCTGTRRWTRRPWTRARPAPTQ